MERHFGILIFIALSTVVLSEKLLDLFHNVQCKGSYDSSKMAKVYTVCQECFLSLIRSPAMFYACLSDCFTSTTFALCLHNYQTNRNHKEDILEMIDSLTVAKIQAE
ncbi:hypothetical protein TNCT_655931 [Trichonephila clavata]|uniref:Uncharacterized protein n=1 Tax=Trichonephila clavata TaxID=2740835 RepID=A0A8X6FZU5_TRICU|nr:hypothetical protein TNCT_655931 [Trichonephila clavata]